MYKVVTKVIVMKKSILFFVLGISFLRADEPEMFSEEMMQEVRIERAMDRIQQDFEKAISWEVYVAPTGKALIFSSVVIGLSLYGMIKLFGLSSEKLKGYHYKSKLTAQESIILPLTMSLSFVYMNYALNRFNQAKIEQEAFKIGKKYNLTGEQCLASLLGCEHFYNLFVSDQIVGQLGIQIGALSTYYQDGQNFIDRYNDYLKKN